LSAALDIFGLLIFLIVSLRLLLCSLVPVGLLVLSVLLDVLDLLRGHTLMWDYKTRIGNGLKLVSCLLLEVNCHLTKGKKHSAEDTIGLGPIDRNLASLREDAHVSLIEGLLAVRVRYIDQKVLNIV
jgi:hypothetical protein